LNGKPPVEKPIFGAKAMVSFRGSLLEINPYLACETPFWLLKHNFAWLNSHYLLVKSIVCWLNHIFCWLNHHFGWLNSHIRCLNPRRIVASCLAPLASQQRRCTMGRARGWTAATTSKAATSSAHGTCDRI
jgi:hypothetical protein